MLTSIAEGTIIPRGQFAVPDIKFLVSKTAYGVGEIRAKQGAAVTCLLARQQNSSTPSFTRHSSQEWQIKLEQLLVTPGIVQI